MAARNIFSRAQFAWGMTPEGMQVRTVQSIKLNRDAAHYNIDPFVTGGTTQLYPLGTEVWWGDRKFKYAKMGASAGAVSTLMQSVVPLVGHIDEVCSTTAVAGDKTINFTPNTVTTDNLAANELQDGYIYINDDTGEGYLYRIKSHPAIIGGTSGVLTLYDPIVVATGASTTATVLHHPLQSVIIHPSPPTAPVVGCCVCAVTGGDYCWLQTWGPCPVLCAGTIVIANNVIPSATADGGVDPAASNGTDAELQQIGVCMAVNATTEETLIDLRIG